MMKKKLTFLVLGFLLSFGTIQAQIWTQIGEDLDADAAGDFFGYEVCLNADGSIMAVGADWNDGNGDKSGQVKVYENIAGIWTQVGNALYGEAAGDLFGISLDISADGTIFAAGSNGNDENGSGAGKVRIFENISGTWTQVGDGILGEAAGDNSASSLSLSDDGSIVAIGANLNEGNGSMAGHVRIFENNAGSWTQIGEDIDGEAAGDLSGSKICLNSDGSVLAIGAHGNDGNGINAGHVRIFENISGTWTQIGEDIDGEAGNDQFGTSISFNSTGSIVALGSMFNSGTFEDAGDVRVFENNDGVWEQIGEDIEELAEDDYVSSVSLDSDGTILAVGAYYNDGNGEDSGHVRVFEFIDNEWTQTGEDINGEAAGDLSGNSVSLSSDGSIVAVGAYKNDGNGVDAGHVRVFYNNSSVAINEISFNTISVYPNPTNSIINLMLVDNIINLEILDVNGKTIFYSNKVSKNQFDISNFENGIYFIKIVYNEQNRSKTDRKTFITKIIKQ